MNRIKYRVALLFLIIFVTGCSQPIVAIDATGDDYLQIISGLQVRYNVRLQYDNFGDPSWESLKCDALRSGDLMRLREYLVLFDREFSKYPPEFVAKTGLKCIYLCKNLQVGSQFRSAVPDYYTECLYYDIYKGYQQKGYHEDVIHHEYYHMIEQQLNGDAYYKDPEWATLNEKGFAYGKGGATVQKVSNVGAYNHPLTGFASMYAASGFEEDKAVTFATLMVADTQRKINKWAKEDAILRAKTEFMKSFLYKNCAEMNDGYWAKILK
ncbi:MAG: hypothetical protein JEZ07_03640 [Phycisphaerae bacterium]|nr:hypothetical protein [Phycisphaerae bacterium]